jgi:hypothetical protein
VVYNARPKTKTRPVVVPTKPMMRDRVGGPVDDDDDLDEEE